MNNVFVDLSSENVVFIIYDQNKILHPILRFFTVKMIIIIIRKNNKKITTCFLNANTTQQFQLVTTNRSQELKGMGWEKIREEGGGEITYHLPGYSGEVFKYGQSNFKQTF